MLSFVSFYLAAISFSNRVCYSQASDNHDACDSFVLFHVTECLFRCWSLCAGDTKMNKACCLPTDLRDDLGDRALSRATSLQCDKYHTKNLTSV